MDRRIACVRASEILDSRGCPTLRVWVELRDGTVASASVPAGGESAGHHEAMDRHDGDNSRFAGQGVRTVALSIEHEIAPCLVGRDAACQAHIDRLMIHLDGTPNKARLGANALLGVSLAVARAAAAACRLPLYAYLGGPGARRLPLPMMNILNGGSHADNNLDLEEFMVVPTGAPSFTEAVRWGTETFHALRTILRDSGFSTGVGDEGGFAPNLPGGEKQACELIVRAIESAGYRPGQDIAIAIDAAAGRLFEDGNYRMRWSGRPTQTRQDLIGLYGLLIQQFPVVAIEDGLVEGDWLGFLAQQQFFGWKVQIIGDDLYATHSHLIAEGAKRDATNAMVIRPGQVGTVTEAMDAVRLCRGLGWGFIVADRAADTEDTFNADFAVAMGGGQIKCGAPSRGERVAKYNRLLEIEQELDRAAVFESPVKWLPWHQAAQEAHTRRL